MMGLVPDYYTTALYNGKLPRPRPPNTNPPDATVIDFRDIVNVKYEY